MPTSQMDFTDLPARIPTIEHHPAKLALGLTDDCSRRGARLASEVCLESLPVRDKRVLVGFEPQHRMDDQPRSSFCLSHAHPRPKSGASGENRGSGPCRAIAISSCYSFWPESRLQMGIDAINARHDIPSKYSIILYLCLIRGG